MITLPAASAIHQCKIMVREIQAIGKRTMTAWELAKRGVE